METNSQKKCYYLSTISGTRGIVYDSIEDATIATKEGVKLYLSRIQSYGIALSKDNCIEEFEKYILIVNKAFLIPKTKLPYFRETDVSNIVLYIDINGVIMGSGSTLQIVEFKHIRDIPTNFILKYETYTTN